MVNLPSPLGGESRLPGNGGEFIWQDEGGLLWEANRPSGGGLSGEMKIGSGWGLDDAPKVFGVV